MAGAQRALRHQLGKQRRARHCRAARMNGAACGIRRSITRLAGGGGAGCRKCRKRRRQAGGASRGGLSSAAGCYVDAGGAFWRRCWARHAAAAGSSRGAATAAAAAIARCQRALHLLRRARRQARALPLRRGGGCLRCARRRPAALCCRRCGCGWTCCGCGRSALSSLLRGCIDRRHGVTGRHARHAGGTLAWGQLGQNLEHVGCSGPFRRVFRHAGTLQRRHLCRALLGRMQRGHLAAARRLATARHSGIGAEGLVNGMRRHETALPCNAGCARRASLFHATLDAQSARLGHKWLISCSICFHPTIKT